MQTLSLPNDLTELRGLLSRANELSSSLIEVIDGKEVNREKPKLADEVNSEGLVLKLAKDIYAFRRNRDRWLPNDLFAEPAWDMLLELFVMRLQGSPVRVKSACIASGVPATTALRWLNLLEQKNIISSSTDPIDQRVRWLWLEDSAFTRIYGMMADQLGISKDPHPALNTREPKVCEGSGR
ncbi:hypothetical protein OVA07_07090 [Novosphingobium sp. SL115]|uniref:hypothetical protein n=1 Tax=Novosphingobium sp. SL115 TaxID=2995150 RepID=UPI002272F39E|nr:hypothetical protein [Novosphingobium sp. SL115]MCY1670780.1 hypothetical protein [Novosphingobium sp. SL115]